MFSFGLYAFFSVLSHAFYGISKAVRKDRKMRMLGIFSYLVVNPCTISICICMGVGVSSVWYAFCSNCIMNIIFGIYFVCKTDLGLETQIIKKQVR